MRKIFIMLFLFSICNLSAQDKMQLLQRINEIKSQSDIYYWDRYTDYNADSAKVNATKRMLLEVNFNRAETELVSVEEIMPLAKYIKIDRGTQVQFFVYMKKEDLALVHRNSANPQIDNDSQVDNASEQSVAIPQPQRPVTVRNFVPDAFVQRVMQTKNFLDVYGLLKSFQADGQILQFGKLKDVDDYSSLELILFDMQSQEVITLLSAVTGTGSRRNLVNGADDALDNYPTKMTAVIWYIKK